MPVGESVNQQEIVQQMLDEVSESGQEVTDRVMLPGLAKLFKPAPANKKVEQGVVKAQSLKKIHLLPREDFVSILVDTIDAYPGICSLAWQFEEQSLKVGYVEGWFQLELEQEVDVDEVKAVLTNILKVRPNMVGFTWEFGCPYVEIHYVAP